MPIIEKHDTVFFKNRREQLIQLVKEQYAGAQKGIILLFGAFETHSVFKQERSFYYLTGIEEPASALMIDLEKNCTTLFVPNYAQERAKWASSAVFADQKEKFGFDEIEYLGQECKGYQCHPFFTKDQYHNLLVILNDYVQNKRPIYTLNPQTASGYVEQRFILQRIAQLISGLNEQLIDISPLVARMRRAKSRQEIEYIYKAIDVTIDAHDAVARAIGPDKKEYEIQALLEYMFTVRGCSIAFPSIVASGKNGTVLHYNKNNATMQPGELVVVDIGAEYNYYCADLTRTFPVSGTFSKRQRELYLIVLETQEYIAQLAQPGMWIANKDNPEKSLIHCAQKFLQKHGYDNYFVHGIGHFLGLDVHDVGDYTQPLQPNDVITIEPGIYIPEENIGIRIEDNYWIVEGEAICLSEDLPKSPDDVELAMAHATGNESASEESEEQEN